MAIFRQLGWLEPTTLPLHQYLLQTLKGTLTHHKPFLFLSWSALYFGIKYWRQSQEKQQQALRARALAKEAELQMMRYQLNPHFLFNALNSASALIRENPARAEVMIGELSELLRHTLTNGKVGDVPLSIELEVARNYLDIEKLRFEDKLIVNFDIDPQAVEFAVPSMLLHPLVENAVKYGMQSSQIPLRVEILARALNGELRLEVVNTGNWIEGNGHSTNIGIENVRQRLRQAFPERHRFDIFERDGRVHAVIEVRQHSQ
jgi:two-component system, LytTR family, sensor kinase